MCQQTSATNHHIHIHSLQNEKKKKVRDFIWIEWKIPKAIKYAGKKKSISISRCCLIFTSFFSMSKIPMCFIVWKEMAYLYIIKEIYFTLNICNYVTFVKKGNKLKHWKCQLHPHMKRKWNFVRIERTKKHSILLILFTEHMESALLYNRVPFLYVQCIRRCDHCKCTEEITLFIGEPCIHCHRAKDAYPHYIQEYRSAV